MCNTKPCDNCCHEEDLLCCMPIKHCCGGYSEHNNCCPHDRCCNQCFGGCGCCDGCPFTPECCCCKAMKMAKKNKEDIEKLNGEVSKLGSDVDELDDKLNEEIERATTAEGDLAEAIDAEEARATAAETTITHNLNIEINRATDREDQIEDALEAEVDRATDRENEIEDNSIADVEYDSNRKELKFVNKEGDVLRIIDASDFVRDGMLDSVTLVDLPNGNKGLQFVFNTDSGKQTITVDVGDWFDESNYWNINTTTQKLSELEDKVTKQLSWSGLSTGSYNGEAAASFIIPNGSVTANTGSVLNSVSINNSTGQLSGTTIALPVVPTNVSELNNDEDYQSGQDVLDSIDTAITNLTQSLSSHYDGGGEFTAVHHIGITDGLLDNTCNSISVPHGSVNATAGQALSGITINQQTGVLTGTSIAIPAVPTLVSQLTNDAGYTTVDKIQIGPNGTIYTAVSGSDTIQIPAYPAAQLQSDWDASSGVTAIANKPTIVQKVRIGSGGTEYTTDINGIIEIPAYPTGSTTNVTIDGTSVNLETLLNQIVDRIDALEALWTRVTDNNVTYLQPVTSTDKVRATAFYDTSVS